MSSYDSAFAYRQSTAFGASPVGQIVTLYDTVLRDLHRAGNAVATGQVEQRVTAVNHALLVIGELEGVLDFERGGEPARNLESFYKVVRNQIVQASMKGSQEAFQEVMTMMTRIRSAWAQVERSAPAVGPLEGARNSSPELPGSAAQNETPRPETSGANGSWRA